MTERIGSAVRVGVAVAALAVVAGARAASGVRADQMVTWSSERSVYRVVDVAGPRSDGRLVLAAGGTLLLFRPRDGAIERYPWSTAPYATNPKLEPYITVAGAGQRM